MQTYLLIIGGADLDKRSGNPNFRPLMLERYLAWVHSLKERGHFVSSGKLDDRVGRRLTSRGGEVMDGPFIESKDAVGGFFLVRAASLDEAGDLARSCPGLDMQGGWIEVRLIEEQRPVLP
jgi:hypothetical protein